MRGLRVGLGLLIAALLSIMLLRNVDFRAALHAALSLSPEALAAAVGLVIAGYLVRARRWQLLLRSCGVGATYRAVLPVFFAGFALNNVLPLRAGDAYRCVATTALPGGTIARSLVTLVVERLLDLGILAAALLALLVAYPPANLDLIAGPLAVVLVVGLGGLLLLFLVPAALQRLLETLLSRRRLAGSRLTRKAADWLRSVGAALQSLLRDRSAVPVIGLTGLAWAIELGVFIAIGDAISLTARPAAGLYAGVLGTLGTLVPGGPGHVGTFDYFAAEGFRMGGFDRNTAVAAALACHIIIVVPVTALGALRLLVDRGAVPNPQAMPIDSDVTGHRRRRSDPE